MLLWFILTLMAFSWLSNGSIFTYTLLMLVLNKFLKIMYMMLMVVGCWHGYLSGVRCRLAYDPSDANATHSLLLQ